MKGHVQQKYLIGYLQNTIHERKAGTVSEHMDVCAQCRNNFETLKKISAPSKEIKLKPGRAVRTAILHYYDNYNVNETPVAPILRKRQFKFAAIAVGAACACAIIFALYSHLQYENAPIYASRVKGTVKADAHLLHKGQQVRPGVLLTTGEDSKLSIMYGKIMKLVAGPHSRISITKSHIDRKSGKIYFEMVINKGSIIAETVKGWKLQYTLITPHGKVSSTGSRIAMRIEPSKTRIMVKDGSANLSSNKGHSVESEEGNGYSITDHRVISAFESTEDDDKVNSTLYDNTVQDLLDDDDDTEESTVIQ